MIKWMKNTVKNEDAKRLKILDLKFMMFSLDCVHGQHAEGICCLDKKASIQKCCPCCVANTLPALSVCLGDLHRFRLRNGWGNGFFGSSNMSPNIGSSI